MKQTCLPGGNAASNSLRCASLSAFSLAALAAAAFTLVPLTGPKACRSWQATVPQMQYAKSCVGSLRLASLDRHSGETKHLVIRTRERFGRILLTRRRGLAFVGNGQPGITVLHDDFAAGPARNLDAAVDAGGRLVTCCFAAAIPAAFLRVTVIVSGSDLATRLEFQRDRELDVAPPQIAGRFRFVLVLPFGGRIEAPHA